MKDPYKVLGLDRSSDPELLQAKYNELHDLYSEQRFKSGEEGNEGARKLQELEEAWDQITAEMQRDTVSASFLSAAECTTKRRIFWTGSKTAKANGIICRL